MNKAIPVGTRVRHKGGIGPDEMVVNEMGPDGTVWCVGWHGSEVKRYKLPVTALETLGESGVMKKLITLGSRVRRKGESGPEKAALKWLWWGFSETIDSSANGETVVEWCGVNLLSLS